MITAAKTWDAQLKALHSVATSAQVATITRPYATALTQLEQQLLSFAATGRLRADITRVVTAEENLTDDVLALSVTTSPNLPTCEATSKTDATTAQTATAALRRALRLPPGH